MNLFFAQRLVVILAASASVYGNVRAATLVLSPVADTMLSEYFPSNNFGAVTFMNCGTSERGRRNRALLRFDLSSVPTGARIDSTTLKVEVTRVSANDYAIAQFGLHRLLVSWGEGASGSSGQGAPATTGEATWVDRFAFTDSPWGQAGGGATNDYVPAASALNFIYNPSDYTFATTTQTVADVQLWLDQPATNFGWIIVCENEGERYTARRIATREDPGNAPLLTVDYTPLVLSNPALVGNQFQFSFTAFAGRSTTVQFNDSPASTNWQTLTNFPALAVDTNVVVTQPLSAKQRFYRLSAP